MVVGEMKKFLACLITFKVEVDSDSGVPSKNLTKETREFFKNNIGTDIKTSTEACEDI